MNLTEEKSSYVCWNNKLKEQPFKGGEIPLYPMVSISILTFCWRFCANIVLKVKVEFYQKLSWLLLELLNLLFPSAGIFKWSVYSIPKKIILLYVDIVLICILFWWSEDQEVYDQYSETYCYMNTNLANRHS